MENFNPVQFSSTDGVGPSNARNAGKDSPTRPNNAKGDHLGPHSKSPFVARLGLYGSVNKGSQNDPTVVERYHNANSSNDHLQLTNYSVFAAFLSYSCRLIIATLGMMVAWVTALKANQTPVVTEKFISPAKDLNEEGREGSDRNVNHGAESAISGAVSSPESRQSEPEPSTATSSLSTDKYGDAEALAGALADQPYNGPCQDHQSRTNIEGGNLSSILQASTNSPVSNNAFRGHTAPVLAVACSPDGSHIASSSWDHTVRVWDASTGEMVMTPLQGHTDAVTSISFSPDGSRLVSGSFDATVRIWDARMGQEIIAPLRGHEFAVQSVVFGPDGSRIVSGSDDGTILFWDSKTGAEMMEPLRGHDGLVLCVAMSSDGGLVASGSFDETVRVWDARTGELVLGPLEGHSDSICSVAFSPDNTRIISGSVDCSIRIWDLSTGQQVLAPLTGHTRAVRSVAFSPDGTRIVSGSSDRTIRVWDARSGEVVWVVGETRGHTDIVSCVAVSPDGTRIVSGSWDRTIRVWDMQTSEQLFEWR